MISPIVFSLSRTLSLHPSQLAHTQRPDRNVGAFCVANPETAQALTGSLEMAPLFDGVRSSEGRQNDANQVQQ
ncbi:hypothetical protein [Sediminicoccus sp. KRV36]|uniref:hypothetical protein n=1 Tax=Sediminicoccus sp. KRV36 TaxID=3133721 RepID=UPI00200D8371|nr:hypothetical protein [Sediminicoccus rosea]UPY39432.1 hypothetical protein LHU95_21290 [Sediminicoccus rosea]